MGLGVKTITSWMVLAAIPAALPGCYRNNIPLSATFGVLPSVTTARVFVDANGRLYPDGWQSSFGASAIRAHHALDAAAPPGDTRRRALDRDGDRQIAEIAARMASSKRIYVLVHGYNNREWEAAYPYDRIVTRLAPERDDMVVRFHWDGLAQTTPGGQLGSWFKAVGYSQMAGMRGLRRILNAAHGKDIFLISHSRGASVVLSALANPSFTKRFQADTEAVTGPFEDVARLADNDNRIRAVLLAPAIGRPDFWDARCRGSECNTLRDITAQLVSIRYTTNPHDPALKKGVRSLSWRFNASNMGLDPTVGNALGKTYDCLHETPIVSRRHGHAFADYVEDDEFTEMIRASRTDTGRCRFTP